MKYIWEKIREKKVRGIIHALKRRLCQQCNKVLFLIYRNYPIRNFSIVLESEGDCCDNAYALFDYMKKNGYVGKYHITWLVDHPENFKNEENVVYTQKDIYTFLSPCTVRALATCHWYIYDHNNMLGRYKREEQLIIYLCHGYAGFKAPKGGTVFKADEEITTGEIPVQGCIDWHGDECPKYILGFPRLDYFYESDVDIVNKSFDFIQAKGFKKNIIWMPTFRKCSNTTLSEDYFNEGTGLPLFDKIEKLRGFNDFLTVSNVQIVLKIHHLQAELDVFKIKFSNIKIMSDKDIAQAGLQLYQLIPQFDALITDYSSISTDYFLLNKPIIYILDDYEQYDKSRGVYPRNAIELMPGDHVYNIEELENSILSIIHGKDDFREERNNLLPHFHTYQDGNASQRILGHLGIKR